MTDYSQAMEIDAVLKDNIKEMDSLGSGLGTTDRGFEGYRGSHGCGASEAEKELDLAFAKLTLARSLEETDWENDFDNTPEIRSEPTETVNNEGTGVNQEAGLDELEMLERDISCWFNMLDDASPDDCLVGLSIPMDDLSDIQLLF